MMAAGLEEPQESQLQGLSPRITNTEGSEWMVNTLRHSCRCIAMVGDHQIYVQRMGAMRLVFDQETAQSNSSRMETAQDDARLARLSASKLRQLSNEVSRDCIWRVQMMLRYTRFSLVTSRYLVLRSAAAPHRPASSRFAMAEQTKIQSRVR